MIASMRVFNGVIVFPSIICPKNFIRVRKIVIYPGLLSCFPSVVFDDIYLRH